MRQAAALALATIAVGCPGPILEHDASALDAATAPDTRLDAAAIAEPDVGVEDAGVGGSPTDVGADAGGSDFDSTLAAMERCDATEIERVMHDVAWGAGWPLAGEGRWLFATRQEDRPSSANLVGDLNAWDTSRFPARRCPDGVHFWVLIRDADLTGAALGSKYKWFVADDASYRAPDEATQYGFDDFGRFGWVRAPRDLPHLEQFPAFESAYLRDTRSFRAYLPAGLEPHGASARTARTLLLHDGQNVFDPEAFFGGWRVDRALASRPDVVAVAVGNAADRMDACTHVRDAIGQGPIGGHPGHYPALPEAAGLPFFRARYGIRAEGASLMVAGSSLGGLVTVHAARSDFASMGCGAALSSTLGWGSLDARAGGSSTLIASWSGLHAPLYLDSGGAVSGACRDADGDGIEDDGDDSDNYCVNLQMVRVLETAGYVRGTSLVYAWDPGAPHNEAAWASRIGDALDACSAMGWRAS